MPQGKPPIEKKEEAAKAVVPLVPETPPAEEKEIRVDSDLYTAIFSSVGGTVKYWEVKKYKDKIGKDVILLSKPGPMPALGIGSNTNFDLARINFGVSGGDLKLDENKKTGSIIFEYTKDDISIRRTYTFYNGSYKVDLTDETAGLPEYWITLGSGFGIFDNAAGYTHVGPALLKGATLEELKPGKLSEPKTFKDDLRWIAQEDKYFFAAIVPAGKVQEARAWTYEHTPVIAFKGMPGENKFVISMQGRKTMTTLKSSTSGSSI